MAITAAHARPHLGRMVHVHSVYGMHRGVLTHVLPDGIMLGNAIRVASCDSMKDDLFTYGDYNTDMKSEEYEQILFGGGFFLPFGGIFGISPFGFGFGGGFFW